MGIKVKIGQRQQHIPPGEYAARVTEIKEANFINKRRGFEFHFSIADGPHHGVKLRGFVNAHYETFSEHTKLRKWALAVSKDNLDPGDELDLDIFYNKVLRVKVKDAESRKTKNLFSNVSEILGVVLEEELT